MSLKTKFTEGEKGEKVKDMPLSEFIEAIYGQFAFFYFEKLEWWLNEKTDKKNRNIEEYAGFIIEDLREHIGKMDIKTSAYLLLYNQFLLLEQNRLDGLKGLEELLTELFYYDPKEEILYLRK